MRRRGRRRGFSAGAGRFFSGAPGGCLSPGKAPAPQEPPRGPRAAGRPRRFPISSATGSTVWRSGRAERRLRRDCPPDPGWENKVVRLIGGPEFSFLLLDFQKEKRNKRGKETRGEISFFPSPGPRLLKTTRGGLRAPIWTPPRERSHENRSNAESHHTITAAAARVKEELWL